MAIENIEGCKGVSMVIETVEEYEKLLNTLEDKDVVWKFLSSPEWLTYRGPVRYLAYADGLTCVLIETVNDDGSRVGDCRVKMYSDSEFYAYFQQMEKLLRAA